MAPRGPQRAQYDPQNGSRWPKIAEDGSEDAPGGPNTAPMTASSGRGVCHGGPQEAQILQGYADVCLLAVLLSIAIRGLKMAPIWPQRGPR
eukprot:9477650-Pyramimonas_sp.AAC.1